MGSVIERVLLVVLVVVVAVETFLVYSTYTTVQAQAAKLTGLETKVERELATVRTEAEARVKRVEDDLARIRRP